MKSMIARLLVVTACVGVLAVASTADVRADFLTNGSTLSFGNTLSSSDSNYTLAHVCDTYFGSTWCFVWWDYLGVCDHEGYWSTLWDGSECGGSNQEAVGSSSNYLAMQTDGNLVLVNGGTNPHTAIWASDTAGYGSTAYLSAQTDGNLVIYYNGSVPIWSVW